MHKVAAAVPRRSGQDGAAEKPIAARLFSLFFLKRAADVSARLSIAILPLKPVTAKCHDNIPLPPGNP